MERISRKRAIRGLVAAAVLACAVTAVAFWSTTGSGTGSGATANPGAQTVTVNQTSASTGLFPGGSVALSGTIDNANSNPVQVATLSATVASVAEPHASAGCSAADYSITGGPVAVNANIPAGGSEPFSGLTLNMANTGSNQDACKGATVNVSYSTN